MSLIWSLWGISVYIQSIYAAKITFDLSRSCQGRVYKNRLYLENRLPQSKKELNLGLWGISVYIQSIYAAKITFDLSRLCQGRVFVNRLYLENRLPQSKNELNLGLCGISAQSIYAAKITFDPSRSHQGHVKVAYMKIGSISKTACRRAKRSLIGASGV